MNEETGALIEAPALAPPAPARALENEAAAEAVSLTLSAERMEWLGLEIGSPVSDPVETGTDERVWRTAVAEPVMPDEAGSVQSAFERSRP
jgi:hypothetical protein